MDPGAIASTADSPTFEANHVPKHVQHCGPACRAGELEVQVDRALDDVISGVVRQDQQLQIERESGGRDEWQTGIEKFRPEKLESGLRVADIEVEEQLHKQAKDSTL